MAQLDPSISMEDVFVMIHKELQDLEEKLPKEKDAENVTYLTGRKDALESVDALICIRP